MPRSSSRKPQPPRHGVINVSTMKVGQAKAHLRMMTQGAAEVRDYGGHEATGCNSQGLTATGGAAGADYETTSTGNTGDSDSTGPTGY